MNAANNPPFDALIVGAGPAGSTAAVLLARAGWSVAIVEKQPFPRRKVCGECIAASNLPLLEALGMAPAAFDSLAAPALQRLALMQGRHSVSAPLPAGTHPRHTWARALGRETLDTLLLAQARAAGARVLQPWSVLSIHGPPGQMRALALNIATGEKTELQARVVILANGSWEPLRSARQTQRRTRRGSDLLAFKANFDNADLAPGLLPVLAFQGGYGGMVVADRHTTTIACCVRADRLAVLRAGLPGHSAGEVVEALLRRECAGVDAALQPAQRRGPWLGSGPIDPGIRLRGDDRVLKIGNAAAEAHPIIGEGMSMAMQSAWLLCERLLTSSGAGGPQNAALWHADVARRYAADWRRHFATRLRLAAVLAHTAMRPLPASMLVAAVRHFPSAVTWGARWCAKVSCAIDPATIARLSPERVTRSLTAHETPMQRPHNTPTTPTLHPIGPVTEVP
jgi:2-polyprenyl-6-methoxyphenol hydroxylase-like FAD-dependent oxidoreductase